MFPYWLCFIDWPGRIDYSGKEHLNLQFLSAVNAKVLLMTICEKTSIAEEIWQGIFDWYKVNANPLF
jgi:hypothetical protein